MSKANYIINECDGVLNRQQLEEILEKLPVRFQTSQGYDLQRIPNTEYDHDFPTLNVLHFAQVISIMPLVGQRISDGSFGGKRDLFSPSRIMDECTGGGACSSYEFNTKELGVDFEKTIMLDIYKLPKA